MSIKLFTRFLALLLIFATTVNVDAQRRKKSKKDDKKGKEVAAKVKDYAPDQIILMPLYPQFSTTTTWSSMGVWDQACKDEGLTVNSSMVCCYPDNDGFIEASAQNILAEWEKAKKHDKVRSLFSAHGLPEKVVKIGSPCYL